MWQDKIKEIIYLLDNSDMNEIRKLIRNKNLVLTQSKKVIQFEERWSNAGNIKRVPGLTREESTAVHYMRTHE